MNCIMAAKTPQTVTNTPPSPLGENEEPPFCSKTKFLLYLNIIFLHC